MAISKFPLSPGISFLNHGAYGCAPIAVEQGRIRYHLASSRLHVLYLNIIFHYSSVFNFTRKMGEINSLPDDWWLFKQDTSLQEAHVALCDFLHISRKNTVFVENTTTGFINSH